MVSRDFGFDAGPLPGPSAVEYARRHERVRTRMAEEGLDVLVVYGAYAFVGSDTTQANAVYLSGYPGFFQQYLVFPRKGEPTLYVAVPPHVPNARRVSVIDDVRSEPGAAAAVAARLVELGARRVGIVGPSHRAGFTIPAEHRDALRSGAPAVEWSDATEMFEAVRLVKSEEEIRLLRRGGEITDAACSALESALRPGVTDLEIYHLTVAATHRAGGAVPFALLGSTAMEDPQMGFPDPFPTRRRLAAGDVMLTEICGSYAGYSGKICATYFLGEPTPRYRELWELALSVYRTLLKKVRPGATCEDLMVAAAPIKEAGLIVGCPVVHGWSVAGSAPVVTPHAVLYPKTPFSVEVGQVVNISANPMTPDRKCGIFLGASYIVRDKGIEPLHAYDVERLRIL